MARGHGETGRGERARLRPPFPHRFLRWPGCCALLLATALLLGLLPGTAGAEADTFGLGTGRSGALSLSATAVVNAYAPITRSVAAGAAEVTIDPTLAKGASGGFTAGDLIMLWHSVGWTAAVTSGDQAPVDLAAANPGPAGLWELARVSAVNPGTTPEAQTLVLSAPTLRAYAAGQAQVVRVPEYTDLTVASGVYLRPSAFDGRCGGMVALLATGTVTLSANDSIIDAGGAGLAGGALLNLPSLPTGCTALDGDPASGYSRKGASFDSRDALPSSSLGGYGNRLSGGGGGNCTNSGGGGGGGASSAAGGHGGNTWSLDLPLGGMGGAGIHGDVRERLLLGGGGGAGEENNSVGSAGGNGGGVVFVRAAALAGAGRIWAHGGDAAAATSDGGGGGGGGGTVALRLSGSAACLRVNVRGGNGAAAADGHGPGGGGGAGTVFLQSASTSCDLLAPGGNGASNSTHSSTAGGAGNLVQPAAGYCGAAVPACPAAAPVCGSDGVCRACAAGAECPASSPICDAGACRKCLGASDCPGAVCDPAGGACVECTADAHCAEAARPVCAAADHACRPCAASAECAGRQGKSCATSGARAGECVECTAAEPVACAAPTPWCSAPDDDFCVACLLDAHCPAAEPVCDPEAQACRACRSEAECPTGHCAVASGIAGTCVACLEDGDCGAGWRCEVATGRCLGCLSSADCADPAHPICRGGACDACALHAECPATSPACWSSGRCLQCSASVLGACAEDQRCDPRGRCVDCLADSDCGAAGSARLCEAGACRDGCRGQGGNGCPAGERCTSADAAPGDCEPSADAGLALDAGQVSDAGAEEPADAGFAPDFGVYDLGGCGCAASPGAGPGIGALVLLAGLALRRRR